MAFQKSQHFQMLEKGDRQVPTCVTCHQEAGARLLSPKALEGQCASCHGPGRVAPRPDRAAQARTMLQGVRDVRLLLREARRLIDDVRDRARKTRLEAAAQQAEVPLVQAVQAGHSFVYDDLQERLATAQRRVALLRAELANPPQR
jgi:excinuclease UvrABC ATPase subunit